LLHRLVDRIASDVPIAVHRELEAILGITHEALALSVEHRAQLVALLIGQHRSIPRVPVGLFASSSGLGSRRPSWGFGGRRRGVNAPRPPVNARSRRENLLDSWREICLALAGPEVSWPSSRGSAPDANG